MLGRRTVTALAAAILMSGGAVIVSASMSLNEVGSDIDGDAANDYLGRSVSLSSDGTIVAIGAHGNDGNGSNSGHVRVFEWDGTAWVQKGSDIEGEAASDQSGFATSLSSDGAIVAIGAHGNDGNGSNSGHVRVFEWDGTAWVQKGSDIEGEAAEDSSGFATSLSSDGTIVAIGAERNDGNGSNSGHVRVYEWSGDTWVQKGSDIDGEVAEDSSGESVSLSSDGTIVAIGAERNDGNGSNSGHVRVYEWSGDTWVQKGNDIDGEAANDYSGRSVSLSSDGTIVAIGADLNHGSSFRAGHVRVYEWSGTEWTQKGNDIDGEAAEDYSGRSVSLSSDGTIVAIGAYGNDGNGSNSGHVRLFEWDGTAWTQKGSDIDGEAVSDKFGFATSLSSDGSIVAIGAYNNDGNGSNAGHVRLYSGATSLNITYDSQGGSDVSDGDVTTFAGGTIDALPTDPTRDGYTFAGWFTAASGGTEITTGAAHNQTADFTLYARWTANPTTTTTETPTTIASTTTVAPTTTTVVLPATGSSDRTVAQVLLVLGIGGLLALFARHRVQDHA